MELRGRDLEASEFFVGDFNASLVFVRIDGCATTSPVFVVVFAIKFTMTS